MLQIYLRSAGPLHFDKFDWYIPINFVTGPSGEAPQKPQALTEIPASPTVIPEANPHVKAATPDSCVYTPGVVQGMQGLSYATLLRFTINPKFEAVILIFSPHANLYDHSVFL